MPGAVRRVGRDPDAAVVGRDRLAPRRGGARAGPRRVIGEPAAARPRAWPLAELALVERVEALVGERARGSPARAGRRTRSPGSPRPAVRAHDLQEAGDPGRSPRRRRGAAASTASMKPSQAGKPARASSIAGAEDRVRATAGPSRACASPHERTAPGTVIDSGPRSGIVVEARGRGAPRRRRAAGARPEPLSATCSPAAASQISQNASPPIPQPFGHDDAEDGVRRDRRVDRRAAGPQDRRARPRSRGGAARRPRRGRRGRAARAIHGRGVGQRRVARRPARAAPIRCSVSVCSCARSRDSGTIAMPSRTSVAMNMPSMPEPVGGDPADRAMPMIWPIAEEDRVEAHDRAAVGREALGHVGEQADGGRRRAGEHEQAAGRDDAAPRSARSGDGRAEVVDDEAGHDERRRRRSTP